MCRCNLCNCFRNCFCTSNWNCCRCGCNNNCGCCNNSGNTSHSADGHPLFYVFNTCKGFIRTIPQLVYDAKNVEDIDTTQEDHIYDECRYFLMQYQIAKRANVKKKPPLDDPLDLYKAEREKAYKIIRI